MADVFFSQGSYGVSNTEGQLVVDAFDRAVELAFKPNLKFAQFAQGKKWNGRGTPEHGESVTFTQFNHLNLNTDALSETSDPDATRTNVINKKVTMYEQGGLIKKTKKLQLSTFDGSIDADLSNLVANNMGMSVDIIARGAFDAQVGASYVEYLGVASKVLVATTSLMTADYIRKGTAVLKGRNVASIGNMNIQATDKGKETYAVIMHPDVWFDVNKETGGGTIRFPSENNSATYMGEVPSKFENANIILTTNAKKEYNAGVASAETTGDGVNAVGAIVLNVTAGTDLSATGGTLTLTIGGVAYTYKYTGKTTHAIDIDRCIDIDGVPQYRASGSGLVVATVDDEAVKEGVDVYTTYFIGYQAIGYAFADPAHVVVGAVVDALKRIQPIGWYGYFGFGEVRPDALYKIYSASSLDNAL